MRSKGAAVASASALQNARHAAQRWFDLTWMESSNSTIICHRSASSRQARARSTPQLDAPDHDLAQIPASVTCDVEVADTDNMPVLKLLCS